MILAWQETHPNIEVNFVENEDVPQDVPQGATKAVYLPNCIKWCMYGQIYGFGI